MTERLVVVGGDAGGMAAASQARRRREDLEIVALEKGRWTSYSACGIPYVVGGDVGSVEELVARSPETFRTEHDIDARTGHEVTGLDLDRREVEVRDLDAGSTYRLGFDVLHLGLGAVPVRPALPGIDGPHIHGVQTLEDADELLRDVADRGTRDVVVVGGGYIGLEMAEAFLNRGCRVTVVEQGPEVMGTLDPDMGALVTKALRDHGAAVRTGEAVVGFEPGRVETASGSLPADLVILGLGVQPNAALAADAGIATGARGAVAVDQRQRTSADGVWAAGDCCESFHLVSRRHAHIALGTVANRQARVHIALGTVANKQGRVAGTNIGGGYATFPGVVGTAITKLCATEVARTGLNERECRQYGFEFVAATVTSTTRAGYFPGSGEIRVKLLAERRSGRLLGGQVVGQEGAAKRIDTLAVCLTTGMTVEAMTGLDLSYAPPFSPVWDPVLVAARKAAELVEEAR